VAVGWGLTAAALLLCALAYGWLITDGTWSLYGYEFIGDTFSELALRLAGGRCDVTPGMPAHEGIKVGDRTVVYFGPWPALLRIPATAIWPQMIGFWSRASCLVAALICLGALVWLTHRALAAAPGMSPLVRALSLPLITLGYGMGTPLLYLMSSGRIYHESILWGLAGSLVCLAAVVALLRGWVRPLPALAVASTAAGVAVLSRLTFGVVAGMVFGVAVIRLLRRRESCALILATCVPALLAVGYQGWYNQCRFGSVAKTIHYPGFYFDPADFGGELNPRRIPYNVSAYLGFRAAHFTSAPPYVRHLVPQGYPKDLYRDFKGRNFPLSISSPWLLAGALAGLLLVVRLRLGWAHLAVLLILSLQWGLILCFHHRTVRYLTELMPALVFLFTVALASPATGGAWQHVRRAGLALLLLCSLLINTAATMDTVAEDGQFAGWEFSARVQKMLGRPVRGDEP